MPIYVTCPGCNAEYSLADRLAGKKVRCKKCESVISVDAAPEADAPPPTRSVADALRAEPPRREMEPPVRPRTPERPRRFRDEGEDVPPVTKGGGLVLWLILGGVGVVLLLALVCGGFGAFFLLTPSAPPAPVVAVAPRPAVPVRPAEVAPPAAPAAQPDPQPKPPPAPQPDPQPNPQPNPPPFPVFPPVNPPPAPALPPAAPPAEPPAQPIAWKVQPDPLPAALTLPDNAQGEIPVGGFDHQILFPTSFSPFVSVGAGGGFNAGREVWDLRTMKRVGATAGGAPGGNLALSPDGASFASTTFGLKPSVDVATVADGGTAKVAVGDGFLKAVDFAGPGQVLTAKAAGADVQIQVWDVKTSKKTCDFKAAADGEPKKWAFSAGRKYLALPAPRANRVLVYDLTTGEAAGELATVGDCQGLAFSADGKALAGLFAGGFGGSRLQVWDGAAGKATAGHVLDKGADNAFFYQGRPLEWLPDGSGWVLYGQLLVDGQSGKNYWRVPAETLDGNPRRVFGGGRVAHLKKGDGQAQSLVVEALPADRVAAALAAVRNGQDAGTASLPPAKAADWSAVKELPAPVGGADWKAVADPAPAPKGALGARPIPLAGKGADLVRLLFSRPDVGQTAVLSAAGQNALSDQKQIHVDRYDLAGSQRLGGGDLFSAEFPKGKAVALDADLSPDGALVATCEPKGRKRIDVWSAADGKHVVGWLPYEKEADASIRWLAFTDDKHLLSVSGGGKLTLWDVPECKAEYAVTFVRDLPALSPGRKYLAAFTGTNFEVLETATGGRAGQMFGPNSVGVLAAAYRPDGAELAAVATTVTGPRLMRWDAATGAAKGDFAVPAVGGDLEWCGPEHVLFGATLIDLAMKWPTTSYTLPGAGRQSPAGPDGRHWFAFSRNPNDPPILTAQKMPDDAALLLAKQVAAGQIQTVLAPGMTVDVRVDGAVPDVDADAFRRDAVSRQTQRLQALGFRTGPGGLTMAFQVTPPHSTGRVRRYETLGFPKREIDIPVIEVTVQGTLTDAAGGVLWTQKQTMATPDTIGIVRAEDLRATLTKAVWDRVAGWAGSAGPGAVMVRGPAGVEALPRPVMLAGGL